MGNSPLAAVLAPCAIPAARSPPAVRTTPSATCCTCAQPARSTTTPRASICKVLKAGLLCIFPEPPLFEEPFYFLVRDPIGRHAIHGILILLRDTTVLG